MKKLKFLIAAIAALACALPLAVSPVFANSGPAYEYGVTPSGAIVCNENSVLQVESETLTFDISNVPTSDMSGYGSRFTAEYTFVNPTAETVHTSMAFPSGMLPAYAVEGLDLTPEIKVDGQSVTAQVRHTYGIYSSDFRTQLKKLYDEEYTDGFYSPELPVTEYEINVKQAKKSVTCYAKHTADQSVTRYIADGYVKDDVLIIPLYDSDVYTTVYVLGEDNLTSLEWTVYEETYVGNRTIFIKSDLTVGITKEGETTLKELALRDAPKDSKVSETDRYNAFASALSDVIWAGSNYSLKFTESQFLTWYLYDVTVAPNSKVVNSVSAPIFPSVYPGRSRYVYEYYLSPAASWSSFGELTVKINTLNELSGADGFERLEGGYVATFSALPDSELSFVIQGPPTDLVASSGGNYGAAIRAVLIAVLVILCVFLVAGITLAIVLPLVIRAKKRKNGKI